MASSKETIAQEIDSYIKQWGGGYLAWYCGISEEPRNRLFNGHNVSEKGDYWIYSEAYSDTEARQVEKHFLEKGCQGGTGGGDEDARYVYVYKISGTTVE